MFTASGSRTLELQDLSMASKKPERISFASITPNNLGTLRKLNSVLFPIRYSEKFYQDVLLPELEDFCKLGPSHNTNNQEI
jgi:hypothetical protein